MKKKNIKWSNLYLDNLDKESLLMSFKSNDISGFSPFVKIFEDKVKKKFNSKYAVACSRGTAALQVAMIAAKKFLKKKKIKIGVPTWSYIAPANAADSIGILKLFDSEKQTGNIDYKKIKNVDVICAVDFAGVPANYKKLKLHKKFIISDAAESLGSKYYNKQITNFADITTTSFQSAKIITTGEGGMIFTNNLKIYKICKLIVNQGYGPKGYAYHDHIEKGFNYRLSGIQAAIGISQFKKLDFFLRKRNIIKKIYDENLKSLVELSSYSKEYQSNNYSYLIFLKNKFNRDNLLAFLKKNNIEAKLWKPIHLYKPYLAKFKSMSFRVAEEIFKTHLRLPINNKITSQDALYVCKIIKLAKNKKII